MKLTLHFLIGAIIVILSLLFSFKNNVEVFLSDSSDQNKSLAFFKISTLNDEAASYTSMLQNQFKDAQFKLIDKKQSVEIFKKENELFSKNIELNEELNDYVPLIIEIVSPDKAVLKEITNKLKTDIDKIDEIVDLNKSVSRFSELNIFINLFFVFAISIFFSISYFIITLVVQNTIQSHQNEIKVYFFFGESYRVMFLKYLKSFGLSFFITLFISFILLSSAYMITISYLNRKPELQFLAHQLQLLTFSQVLVIILGIGISYFLGLFRSLKSSLRETYLRV